MNPHFSIYILITWQLCQHSQRLSPHRLLPRTFEDFPGATRTTHRRRVGRSWSIQSALAGWVFLASGWPRCGAVGSLWCMIIFEINWNDLYEIYKTHQNHCFFWEFVADSCWQRRLPLTLQQPIEEDVAGQLHVDQMVLSFWQGNHQAKIKMLPAPNMFEHTLQRLPGGANVAHIVPTMLGGS